ncbi:hypothetical protein P7K49_035364, partial [Saguinus oedipus]
MRSEFEEPPPEACSQLFRMRAETRRGGRTAIPTPAGRSSGSGLFRDVLKSGLTDPLALQALGLLSSASSGPL